MKYINYSGWHFTKKSLVSSCFFHRLFYFTSTASATLLTSQRLPCVSCSALRDFQFENYPADAHRDKTGTTLLPCPAADRTDPRLRQYNKRVMKQVCISNVQTCFFISAVQIFTLCQEINPALFRNFILFLNLRNRYSKIPAR